VPIPPSMGCQLAPWNRRPARLEASPPGLPGLQIGYLQLM
jgi:hypothetical protein